MVGREEIRQTEDGSYRLYWRDDSGKTRSRPIAAGKNAAKAGRRDRVRGLTVKEALDGYAREHRVADEERRETIVNHLSTFFGTDEIASIDLAKSRAYAEARRTGKVGGGLRRRVRNGSDSTIRRELVVLVSAAKHALKHKRIAQMPVIELPAAQSVGQDDEVAYFSKSEIQALLDNSTGELHHFVAIAYATGARRASIEGLRRAQVQWDRRRIILQPEGKIATKKRQPIVPIFKSMEPHLRALWDASPNDRLFVRSDFYAPFRELCERLGMAPEKCHPHVLRHSRVSHLLISGKSIYDVAKLVGDTIGTIEKTYGHHSAGYLADLLD